MDELSNLKSELDELYWKRHEIKESGTGGQKKEELKLIEKQIKQLKEKADTADRENKLKAMYMKWQEVKKNGTDSPSWTDGEELNGIQRQIVRQKKEMKEQGVLTDTYFKETPPVMPQRFMVHAEDIREKAKQTLEAYLASEDYQFIFSSGGILEEQQRDWICLEGIISNVLKLQKDIEKDNLVHMKKHIDPEPYLKLFKKCRKQMEELIEEMKELEPPEEPEEPEVYEQMKLSLI